MPHNNNGTAIKKHNAIINNATQQQWYSYYET